jgi:protein-disulfide isomerase
MTERGGARLTEPVAARDHVRGPATARVTLVQYGDFQCPFSGEAWGIVLELQRRHPADIRYVFRNFPLSHVHPDAQGAAEAAEAAAAQGKFWEMHDMLFENQRWLEEGDLRGYAADIGLDVMRFEREMAEHAHAARVHEDLTGGRQSRVQGTPTFFVNGEQQGSPSDSDAMLAAFAAALRTPSR